MPYYLTKKLPLLVMPVSIAMVIMVLALFFVLTNRRKLSIFSLLTAISVLWISSLPAVAERLLWGLQGQYLPVAIKDIPMSDCIVVLGGSLGRPDYPRVDIELTDATDRIYQTAKIYRAGKAKTVIVAAGNQPWNQHGVPEAKLISELLVEWGVLPQAIALDIASKNTRENAVNAASLLGEYGCQSSLLVTSALHMPRAVAAFRKVGAEMFPVAVDVASFGGGGLGSLASFIPQAGALATTSAVIKEWMGIWIYRWRGWN
jgi:uncharacterized SAM-binding protein YcdF (DUF218 family)